MPLPSQLGNYLLERAIGHGASSEVWLARHVHLRERQVALKVMRSPDREKLLRFEREAMLAARLRHEHIVQLYDYGLQDPFYFAAFEYVPGRSLHDLITQRTRLPIGEALAVFRQIAAALDYAHSLKIVHRDVSSSNILVDPANGRALITDFGIARDTDRPITVVRSIMGTPGYLSPEHAQSATAVTHLSDLFSLGVVLYQMISGRLPWEENTGLPEGPPFGPFTPLTQLNLENIPPDFDRLINSLLAIDPARRYASGAAAVADLDRTFNRHQRTTQLMAPNQQTIDGGVAGLLPAELTTETTVETVLGADMVKAPLERSRRHAEELRNPQIISDLLDQWSTQGRMRRRMLGRLAHVHKIVHRNVYFYRLRLVYEQRRFIEDEELPDRTKQEFPVEAEVDRWQVQLPPIREFADAPGDQMTLPGSTRVVPCPPCEGKGYLICPVCKGRRRVLVTRPPATRPDQPAGRPVAATLPTASSAAGRGVSSAPSATAPAEAARVEQVLMPCSECAGHGRIDCKRCAKVGSLVQRRRFAWSRRADLRQDHDDLPDLDETWLYQVCKAEVIYAQRQNGGTRPEWALIPRVAAIIKQAESTLDPDSRIAMSELTVSVIPVAEVVFDLGKTSERDLYKLAVYGFENMIPADWRFLDWDRVVMLCVVTFFFLLTIIVSLFALL